MGAFIVLPVDIITFNILLCNWMTMVPIVPMNTEMLLILPVLPMGAQWKLVIFLKLQFCKHVKQQTSFYCPNYTTTVSSYIAP